MELGDWAKQNLYESYEAEVCPICGDQLLYPNPTVSCEFRECLGCGRNTDDDIELVYALRRR